MTESSNLTTPPQPPPRTGLALFARGFLALLPLWTGALPVGIGYGAATQSLGLAPGEAQLMSLVVFSAAAQVSVVSLLTDGAPFLVILGTALALNAQLPLIGLAVRRQVRLSWAGRLLVGWFLTDGVYAVSAARGPLRAPLLLGAGVSMYVAWNLGTSLGIVLGRTLPDPRQLGIDFVVPLTFLAVLVPLLRTRTAALVALVAGAATPLLGYLLPGGVAVLGAALLGSGAGAWSLRWVRESRTGGSAPH